jgi:hypothetical protein
MAVGLVVEDAVAQPDRLADAEIGLEVAFDLGAREAGIAVVVEQALLCRQQRALAIDMDDPPSRTNGAA